MRFRELYQADFTAIEPRPELLAATRALYAQHAQATPRAKWHIPASALGMAACLLLAVGLCLGLPGSTGGGAGNIAPMSRSVAEDMPEAQQDIQVADYNGAIKTTPEAIPEKGAAKEGAQSRMAAPLTDTAGADRSKLCSLPPASYFARVYFDSVCETDSALQPLFALKLLQPVRNNAAYLVRCGLWLTQYTIY